MPPTTAINGHAPRVLLLDLDYQHAFGIDSAIFSDLIVMLSTKAKVHCVETPSDALDYLANEEPSAILVTDGTLLDGEAPHLRDLSEKLVSYAKNGGTVVLGGPFAAGAIRTRLDVWFERVWNLPWKTGECYRTDVSLNLERNGLQGVDLPKTYKPKTVFIRNIAKEDQVYYVTAETLIREGGLAPERANDSQIPVAVAMVKIGNGCLGYHGDTNVEREGFETIVAMRLFYTSCTFIKLRLRTSYHPEDLRALCESQQRAIPALRKLLAANEITDGVLTYIRCLGMIDAEPDHHDGPVLGLFESIGIERLGGLKETGEMRYDPGHYEVIRRLLIERGGISTIKNTAVQYHATRGYYENDLVHSYWTLSTPSFPLCTSHQLILERDIAPQGPPASNIKAFSTGNGSGSGSGEAAPEIREGQGQGQDEGAGTSLLVQHREIVQHRVLSLPHGDPATEIGRLGLLVFAFGVTYPLPRSRPLRLAAEKLGAALRTPLYARHQDPALLLWANVLGAMATGGSPESSSRFSGFLGEVAVLSSKLGLLHGWDEAKAVLGQFVWLDRACDDAGRAVWHQACFPRLREQVDPGI
ncbi:hypothetical protein F4778DRAFT_781165 [Xylariomycetidae sp. FL2044]|nr:hypothetical protein F4778DRAFT_781165 [Xylariomycetidae sp. FL2044]